MRTYAGKKMTFDEVCRRAGGRRRYNAGRTHAANERRAGVAKLLVKYGRNKRGTRARIARELGVSEATISRDIAHPTMLIYLSLFGGRNDLRTAMRLVGW